MITVYEDDSKFNDHIPLFHKAKPMEIVTIEGSQ